MKKQEAIYYLNRYQKTHFLHKSNTSFSIINESKLVFGFNIKPEKFNKEHYFLCMDNEEFVLIHLTRIKCNSIQKTLKIREDKGSFDIELPIKGEPGYLKDINSGLDFKPFAKFYRLKDVLVHERAPVNTFSTKSYDTFVPQNDDFKSNDGCLLTLGSILVQILLAHLFMFGLFGLIVLIIYIIIWMFF